MTNRDGGVAIGAAGKGGSRAHDADPDVPEPVARFRPPAFAFENIGAALSDIGRAPEKCGRLFQDCGADVSKRTAGASTAVFGGGVTPELRSATPPQESRGPSPPRKGARFPSKTPAPMFAIAAPVVPTALAACRQPCRTRASAASSVNAPSQKGWATPSQD